MSACFSGRSLTPRRARHRTGWRRSQRSGSSWRLSSPSSAGAERAGKKGARLAAATMFAVWAFGAGVLGVLLTLLWTVTDHHFAHRNENLLLFNPLWLVLAVFVPMTAVKGRLSRTTRWLTFFLAGLGVIALLMHLTGLSRESNGEIIAFALPPMLALAWVVHSGTAHARRSGARMTASDSESAELRARETNGRGASVLRWGASRRSWQRGSTSRAHRGQSHSASPS